MKKEIDPEFLKLDSQLSLAQILSVEELRSARYLLDTCTRRDKNGEYGNYPTSVFWTDEAHERGSNYFGLFKDPMFGKWYICDAISVTWEPIHAFRIKDWNLAYPVRGTENKIDYDNIYDRGPFKWSHYRHDCRQVVPGLAIDGGRDYTRIIGNINSELVEPIEITIENGRVYYESAIQERNESQDNPSSNPEAA